MRAKMAELARDESTLNAAANAMRPRQLEAADDLIYVIERSRESGNSDDPRLTPRESALTPPGRRY